MEFFSSKFDLPYLRVFLQPNLLHSRGGGNICYIYKSKKNLSWVFSGQKMGSCQEDTTCLKRHNLYVWINALYGVISLQSLLERGENSDGLRRSKPGAVNTKTPLFYFCRILLLLLLLLLFLFSFRQFVARCWFWDVGAGIALPPLRPNFMTLFHMIMIYINCFYGREERWSSEGRVVREFWVEQRLCSWKFSLTASPSFITYQNLKEFNGKMLLEVTVKSLTLSV